MKFGIGTAQFIDNYGYMKKKTICKYKNTKRIS